MASNFVLSVVVLSLCSISIVNAATECKLFSFGESSVEKFIDKVVNRCPMFPGSEDEYCCYDFNLKARCCNSSDFILNAGVMLLIVIVALMLLSSLLSIICCVLCPCCYCYKRRRGRVIQEHPATTNVIISRNHTESEPMVKPHHNIPPGAYPVLPTHNAVGEKYFARSHS